MPSDSVFLCGTCAEPHPGPPLSYGQDAPAYWSAQLESNPANVLEQEICVIAGQGFFIRGVLEIPVVDSGETFSWGVWVTQSKENFRAITESWDRADRENRPPSFGWLATALPYDPPTVNLETMLHVRPRGERPFIELEPTSHPLAVEQREGITSERVREIAAQVLHRG